MKNVFSSQWGRGLIILLIGTVTVAAGYFYWQQSWSRVSTQDAYIQAHVNHTAPQVTGRVQTIMVDNNQYVRQGDLLFTLDPTQYRTALKQAEAKLEGDKARLDNLKTSVQRSQKLARQNALSQQETDDVVTEHKRLKAAIKADRAQVEQAKWNLKHTQIKAPASGWITQLSLRPGDAVGAYQDQFAIVNDQSYWVQTNLKETKLQHIKPGQCATIAVDMYPERTFHGQVTSISHGSGNAFSLLPPQNATGNWVKITQRVPVRVTIHDADNQHPLRVGTSAEVTIHTQKNHCDN